MTIDDERVTADAPAFEEVVRTAFGQVLQRADVEPDADFFDLGGQSLQAVEVALELRRRTGIPVDLDLLFTYRRPVDVGTFLAQLAPSVRPTTMSPTEERMLFLDRLHPGSPLYCVPVRYQFDGELDTEALHAVLQDLVSDHEALRTCFTADGRRLVQSAATPSWTVLDLSGEEPERAAAETGRHIAAEVRRPIPTDVAPLARASLVIERSDRHVLLLTLHHLIADQHSLDLLDRQLQQRYGERVGLSRDLPPLSRRGLAGRPDPTASRDYWRGQLAGLGGRMALPADRTRPDVVGPDGEVVSAALEPDLVARLAELAIAASASEFMVLLAAYAAFLGRATATPSAAGRDATAGREAVADPADVVVGAPLSGRTADDEQTVGMFVNVLPIRVRVSADVTFRQLVTEVRALVSAALAYQQTPLQELVAEAAGTGGARHHPLTQVSISHVDNRRWHWAPTGAQATRMVLPTGTAKYELLWTVTTDAASSTSMLEASSDLFSRGRAEHLHNRLLTSLTHLVSAPDEPVGPLLDAPTGPASDEPVGSLPDAAAGSVGGGDGYRRQPAAGPVHELVAARARVHPSTVAIRHGQRDVTYGELDAAASALAGRLVSEGVRPGDRVAVVAERGADAVTAFLAVLRAGAAYLPIDVAQPPGRSRAMMRDSDVRLALCEQGSAAHAPDEVRTVGLAEALAEVRDAPRPTPAVPVTVRHAAYVMYTSGSTGTPKGVVIPHEAICRLVPRSNYLRIRPQDVVAHLSNVAFDAATLEIWGALCAGATLAVVPREVALSPHEMARLLARTGVSVMFTTNALLNAIVAHVADAFAGLRVLLIGGDQYALDQVRRMLAAGAPQQLLNAYGPTENTTFSAAHRVTDTDLARGVIPIGGAIDGTYLRVLDDRLTPVAPGDTGELYVGGQGLADGYVNDARRSCATFVADPFAARPGDRLYRTGDRVRLLPDGGVVFLGRRDDQVKVSGFRVELGEVERALRACPGVGDGAVSAVTAEGGTELVAVLTGPADPAEVREHLRANLPAYMVPARCHRVDRLPMTRNGKVDRSALAALYRDAGSAAVPDAAVAGAPVADVPLPPRDRPPTDPLPTDPVSAGLADIWRNLLGVADFGVDSNFFELGGTSIKALHLVGAVHRQFHVDLQILAVFRRPSFADLAGEVTDLVRTRVSGADATEGAR
ncbi:amino acid adenylation domain-containing protein [Micromonospora sp. LOL_021]|uniref:non-ribosomal peptide synthetase n=1 Tax=Micromonospora sp. LOL_021 TaxID=3345417 RepID=UPI003A8C47BE